MAATGLLGPKDRFATDDELAETLAALAEPKMHVAHFGAALGESKAQMLALALSQVGYRSPSGDNQHSQYNGWYAALHGPAYNTCAWCAIFQCWLGRTGAIPPANQSAGALQLLDNFPACAGRSPGALIGYDGRYYPGGHIELVIRPDADVDYCWTVGGNTAGGTGGPIGVYYCRRFLPGNVVGYSMPHYSAVPGPAPAPVPSPKPAPKPVLEDDMAYTLVYATGGVAAHSAIVDGIVISPLDPATENELKALGAKVITLPLNQAQALGNAAFK